MKPLYKGQVESGASLQGTGWGVEPLYKGQVGEWSLSTRDRLGSEASLQGTGWGVEPLYKGRGASLQGTGWGVEPLYKGQVIHTHIRSWVMMMSLPRQAKWRGPRFSG